MGHGPEQPRRRAIDTWRASERDDPLEEAATAFRQRGFAEETAFRNSSLQGAYFIIAARALGLDTGPMSGFDAAGVNKEFFPDGKIKVNFICNLGYGEPEGIMSRSPRFAFEEFCTIL